MLRTAFILVVTLVFTLLGAGFAHYMLGLGLLFIWYNQPPGLGDLVFLIIGMATIAILAAYVYSAYRLIKKKAA